MVLVILTFGERFFYIASPMNTFEMPAQLLSPPPIQILAVFKVVTSPHVISGHHIAGDPAR